MNEELEQRWRGGKAPFDGYLLTTEDGLALPALRQVLWHCLTTLKQHYASEQLYILVDWHNHDGFIKVSEATDWEAVQNAFVSDEALHRQSQGDFHVYTGLYPETYIFYLRYYIPEEHDNDHKEPWGYFDLACGEEIADAILRQVQQQLEINLQRTVAKPYFDCCYSG